MKTVKFVPKACEILEGVEPKFTGHVELRVPNIFERSDLKLSYLRALTQDGMMSVEEIGNITSASALEQVAFVHSLLKGIKLSIPYYVSVDIKKLSSGEEYKSFEDLSCDPEAEEIVQEVAAAVCNGTLLSKN